MATEVHRHAEEYYPAYLDGHLLTKGGWADQSARYAEFMLELRSLENRMETKYLKLMKDQETS